MFLIKNWKRSKNCDALAPIEMTVEYLCKEDANLLVAEKLLNLLLKSKEI